jgi:intracellular multiplication protein IcmW
MPDLSKGGVQEYWNAHDPKMLDVMMAMESIEKRLGWTMDDQVEDELQTLGNDMEQALKQGTLLTAREDLVFIMAYLSSGKAMRIMQWLDMRFDGMGYRILETIAEGARHGNFDAAVMMDRFVLLRRIRHIGRVFSTSRIAMVLRLLDRVAQQKGQIN